MSLPSFKSSRPDRWVSPRPHSDPSLRLQTYGPIQPMDKTGPLIPSLSRDPRRGTIRLVVVVALTFIVLVTVGSETGRAILQGIPA